MTKAPLRWSRIPGGYNNESYRLRKGGVDVAVVALANAGGWYSYGLNVPAGQGWNTITAPSALDEVKADAAERVRRALASEEK